MKQIRKNKTNQSVTWPTSTFFTIKELWKLNPKFVEITLRVRLTNAIADGKVVEIGAIPGGKGRPEKIFSCTPVTKLTLDKARTDGINLVDNAYEKLINVLSVNSPITSTSVKAPVTADATKVAVVS